MSNIIIPVQHQSAPKTPLPIQRPLAPSQPTGTDFDAELDDPPCTVSTDPRVNAKMRGLYEQAMQEEQLDFTEEALRQFEKNERAMKQFRWEGQERWQGRQNEEARLVRILHPHTFVERLRRAGIAALVHDPLEWYRDNLPVYRRCFSCQARCGMHAGRCQQCGGTALDTIDDTLKLWPKPEARLWLNAQARAGRVGISTWKAGKPTTVTTLQYPYGPEYSIMRFDKYGVPTTEKYRGWRTALIALIRAEVLTEAEAERAFGPALGPAASFYNQQLYQHRAIRLGVAAQ